LELTQIMGKVHAKWRI